MKNDAGHLIPLADGWHLWREVCLRSTGFPVTLVDELALGAVARDEAERTRLQGVLADMRKDALREVGDALRDVADDDPRRKPLRAVRAALREAGTVDAVAASELGGAAARVVEVQRALAEIDAPLEAENSRVKTAVRALATEPRIREAITWQNRGALRGSIAGLLRAPAGAVDSKTRESERLVAKYVQRYAMKNESIGFFGPVGWGSFELGGPDIELAPGASLLRRRTVYFEYWAIDAIASKIAEDPAVRPWLPPRRVPSARVEEGVLYVSADRSFPLAHEDLRLLALCDGRRTPNAIAAELVASAQRVFASEEEVYAAIERLRRSGALLWSLDVPPDPPFPEIELRRQLERIDDAPVRERALGALTRLEAARDGVARAAGDDQALEAALSALEEVFIEETGRSATRRPGQAYASRQLVYEDCQRDVDIRLGPGMTRRLGPPLALLLQSARWFTWRIAEVYRARIRTAFQTLSAGKERAQVEAGAVFKAISAEFASTQFSAPRLVAAAIDELHARWARVLGIPANTSRVDRSSEDIGQRAREEFSAPGPGWPGARYHSPDILIAARDVEAINKGDFLAVLGELHPGLNAPLSIPPMFWQHPDPERLRQARAADCPEPWIAPVLNRQAVDRAAFRSPVSWDLHFETDSSRSWRPADQVFAVADLVMVEQDGELAIQVRGTNWSFDPIEFFQHYFVIATAGHFNIVASDGHTPRVTIDGLVVARERWVFKSSDIDFASADERPDTVIEATRWAARNGLPSRVFVKVAEEPKPMFLDFRSPPLVGVFIRLVRKATKVSFSELLPSADDAWLVDARGGRYCCELRMVARDPQAWKRPGT